MTRTDDIRTLPDGEIDTSFVDEAVARTGTGAAAAVGLLQAIQGHYGYLPPAALERACEITDITPSQIAGVSTFYSQFRHRPVGKHLISVCHGTACHVKGAARVTDALHRRLGIADGEDTDGEGLFTVCKVACLGCCTLAPVMQIDGVTYGHLTPDNLGDALADFLELQHRRPDETPPAAPTGAAEAEIRVGLGSCCVARGSGGVHEALVRAVAETGAAATIKRVGCVGMCHQTPLVEVVDSAGRSFRYARVNPPDARGIVLRHLAPRGLARRIGEKLFSSLERALTDEAWEPVTRYALDVRDPEVKSFLADQHHLATEHCGSLDPTDLDDYVSRGGFDALRECCRADGGEIIERIASAGLRGRGGAGYNSADKWRHVREAPGGRKYVLCNGDEGDPGAFMDRMILESFPYRVIEGTAIAARAVGASEGVLYVRQEYPLAVRRLREAIDRCRAAGLLGERVCGTDFAFDLRIAEGAGAFVCGEETAMLASLAGRRGTPRIRPPYPSERGLDDRPTLVSNVETFALVPWVCRNGAEAFAAIGTERSPGTKVFALAGKVARGGLIEVPMGITVREIVERIGGGVAGGKSLKAVQVGGPSGGCVPAALCDTPVDYEALRDVGAIMGSGGMVVLDEDDCMVEIARYFLQFTQDQSCGKCTFCRVGTRRMLEMLERLCAGQGRAGDLDKLERLARDVQAGSLCGLGKTAPNPVLSTLRHFRDEYEAHIQGRCPARHCKAMIAYTINDDCIGCTLCAQHCPADAIEMRPYETHEIDPDKCIRCDTCRQVCPVDAVDVQ